MAAVGWRLGYMGRGALGDRRCAVTPEQIALRDAFLAEMWPTCREVSIGDRLRKRKEDRELRDELLIRGIHTLSPPVEEMPTGNPETTCGEPSEGAA